MRRVLFVIVGLGCMSCQSESDSAGISVGERSSIVQSTLNGSLRGEAPDSESMALRAAYIESIQREARASSTFHVRPSGAGLAAAVETMALHARYDSRGAEFIRDEAAVRLGLVSVARGRGRTAIVDSEVAAVENDARWTHVLANDKSVEELWRTGPLGFEHRIRVLDRPA